MGKQKTPAYLCQLVHSTGVYRTEAGAGVGLGAASNRSASAYFQSSAHIFVLNNHLQQTLGVRFHLVFLFALYPLLLLYDRRLPLAFWSVAFFLICLLQWLLAFYSLTV